MIPPYAGNSLINDWRWQFEFRILLYEERSGIGPAVENRRMFHFLYCILQGKNLYLPVVHLQVPGFSGAGFQAQLAR